MNEIDIVRDISHTEIQLGNVKNLIATGYDAAYLQRWTREPGPDNLFEKCLK